MIPRIYLVFFKQKGGFISDKVDLYELRGDPRAAGADTGRSINLALSHRGRKALKRIGLEDECLKEGYMNKVIRGHFGS